MKKLMIAAAAALCATVGMANIESANIVGYTTYGTQAKRQPSFGASFLPMSGAKTYKLGDLKPADFDVDNDAIMVVNPSTLGTDAQYVYMSKEIADAAAEADGEEPGAYDELVGWWDAFIGVGEDGAKADDVEINVGQAFLGLFDSGNDIGFTSSGDVPLTTTAIKTGGKRQPFFASYIPTTITLGDIVPEGFDVDNDAIMVVNPSTLGTDAQYVYMSKEIADAAAEADGEEPGAYDELVGWWDAFIGVGEDGASANEVEVLPGASYLGLFDSGNDIQFNFPSSVKKAE